MTVSGFEIQKYVNKINNLVNDLIKLIIHIYCKIRNLPEVKFDTSSRVPYSFAVGEYDFKHNLIRIDSPLIGSIALSVIAIEKGINDFYKKALHSNTSNLLKTIIHELIHYEQEFKHQIFTKSRKIIKTEEDREKVAKCTHPNEIIEIEEKFDKELHDLVIQYILNKLSLKEIEKQIEKTISSLNEIINKIIEESKKCINNLKRS